MSSNIKNTISSFFSRVSRGFKKLFLSLNEDENDCQSEYNQPELQEVYDYPSMYKAPSRINFNAVINDNKLNDSFYDKKSEVSIRTRNSQNNYKKNVTKSIHLTSKPMETKSNLSGGSISSLEQFTNFPFSNNKTLNKSISGGNTMNKTKSYIANGRAVSEISNYGISNNQNNMNNGAQTFNLNKNMSTTSKISNITYGNVNGNNSNCKKCPKCNKKKDLSYKDVINYDNKSSYSKQISTNTQIQCENCVNIANINSNEDAKSINTRNSAINNNNDNNFLGKKRISSLEFSEVSSSTMKYPQNSSANIRYFNNVLNTSGNSEVNNYSNANKTINKSQVQKIQDDDLDNTRNQNNLNRSISSKKSTEIANSNNNFSYAKNINDNNLNKSYQSIPGVTNNLKTLDEVKRDLDIKRLSNRKYLEDIKAKEMEINRIEIEERRKMFQQVSNAKPKEMSISQSIRFLKADLKIDKTSNLVLNTENKDKNPMKSNNLRNSDININSSANEKDLEKLKDKSSKNDSSNNKSSINQNSGFSNFTNNISSNTHSAAVSAPVNLTNGVIFETENNKNTNMFNLKENEEKKNSATQIDKTSKLFSFIENIPITNSTFNSFSKDNDKKDKEDKEKSTTRPLFGAASEEFTFKKDSIASESLTQPSNFATMSSVVPSNLFNKQPTSSVEPFPSVFNMNSSETTKENSVFDLNKPIKLSSNNIFNTNKNDNEDKKSNLSNSSKPSIKESVLKVKETNKDEFNLVDSNKLNETSKIDNKLNPLNPNKLTLFSFDKDPDEMKKTLGYKIDTSKGIVFGSENYLNSIKSNSVANETSENVENTNKNAITNNDLDKSKEKPNLFNLLPTTQSSFFNINKNEPSKMFESKLVGSENDESKKAAEEKTKAEHPIGLFDNAKIQSKFPDNSKSLFTKVNNDIKINQAPFFSEINSSKSIDKDKSEDIPAKDQPKSLFANMPSSNIFSKREESKAPELVDIKNINNEDKKSNSSFPLTTPINTLNTNNDDPKSQSSYLKGLESVGAESRNSIPIFKSTDPNNNNNPISLLNQNKIEYTKESTSTPSFNNNNVLQNQSNTNSNQASSNSVLFLNNNISNNTMNPIQNPPQLIKLISSDLTNVPNSLLTPSNPFFKSSAVPAKTNSLFNQDPSINNQTNNVINQASSNSSKNPFLSPVVNRNKNNTPYSESNVSNFNNSLSVNPTDGNMFSGLNNNNIHGLGMNNNIGRINMDSSNTVNPFKSINNNSSSNTFPNLLNQNNQTMLGQIGPNNDKITSHNVGNNLFNSIPSNSNNNSLYQNQPMGSIFGVNNNSNIGILNNNSNPLDQNSNTMFGNNNMISNSNMNNNNSFPFGNQFPQTNSTMNIFETNNSSNKVGQNSQPQPQFGVGLFKMGK